MIPTNVISHEKCEFQAEADVDACQSAQELVEQRIEAEAVARRRCHLTVYIQPTVVIENYSNVSLWSVNLRGVQKLCPIKISHEQNAI